MEDMSLASELSQQYDQILEKQLQTFPLFNGTSNAFSEALLGGFETASIVRPSTFLRSVWHPAAELCDITVSSGTTSDESNPYKDTLFSITPSSSSTLPSHSEPGESPAKCTGGQVKLAPLCSDWNLYHVSGICTKRLEPRTRCCFVKIDLCSFQKRLLHVIFCTVLYSATCFQPYYPFPNRIYFKRLYSSSTDDATSNWTSSQLKNLEQLEDITTRETVRLFSCKEQNPKQNSRSLLSESESENRLYPIR